MEEDDEKDGEGVENEVVEEVVECGAEIIDGPELLTYAVVEAVVEEVEQLEVEEEDDESVVTRLS